MKRFLVSGMAAIALVLSAPAALAELEASPLTIESANGAHTFTVEVADEPEEITTGLMNRKSMDADAGMLFDFGQPREAAMWMKNTLIPLDMLFMDPNGKIIAIARETVPGSLRTISPGVPVKSVLELNGGRAAELGIEPGDEVVHPIFGNTDE